MAVFVTKKKTEKAAIQTGAAVSSMGNCGSFTDCICHGNAEETLVFISYFCYTDEYRQMEICQRLTGKQRQPVSRQEVYIT